MSRIILRKAKEIFDKTPLNKILLKRKLIETKYFMPSEYIVETTNFCNLQCRLCDNPRLKRKKENMSFETFLEIFYLIKSSAKSIDFDLGGEPLINPDTLKMVKVAAKEGIKTSLATNAHFLNKENINEIFDSGLSNIFLSFGGMTKETYNFYHAGGDFEKAKENITALCNEKKRRGATSPKIELSFLVTRKSEPEIPLIKKFAKEIGVDVLLLKSLHHAWVEDKEDIFTPKNKRFIRKPTTIPCAWSQKMVIYVNGDVGICCYDQHGKNVYGNILKEKQAVWFRNYKIRERIFNRQYEMCKNCSQGANIGQRINLRKKDG